MPHEATTSTALSCDQLNLLWAKIGKGTYEERHPLLHHLIDVGCVAGHLWQGVLRQPARERFASALGLDTDAAGRWMSFWTAAHDIGKASPWFQARNGDARVALHTAGFNFTGASNRPHGTISTGVLQTLLVEHDRAWTAVDKKLARRVAIAVGGHHGLFPASNTVNELSTNELGCGYQWDHARHELLGNLTNVFGLCDCSAPRDLTGPDAHWPMMVLAGLTSVADWIASNKDDFRHTPDAIDIASYAKLSHERANDALSKLGWLAWQADQSNAQSFEKLFPKCFPPRPLQEAVIDAAERIVGPSLVLIEAPMGEGKTEAALYLADQWNHAHSGQGLYVALPTMATGNQMFERVTEFLKHRYPEDRINLHLVHGLALLSEQYDKLRLDAIADIHDNDDLSGKVVAEEWFAKNKKQAMLAPFGVGTIDQALLSVLQVKHVFVRLFGLAGKMVILDEVHAYDTYMSALLERLLEWLHALGCSVVLLSATLPAERRTALLKAWTGKEPPEDTSNYPRLTIAHGSEIQSPQPFNTDLARRSKVQVTWCETERLAEELKVALGNGGCAAVIRNTVGEAQATYRLLKEQLGFKHPSELDADDVETPTIDLFHARFVFDDRRKIEERVLERYGKGSDGEPHNPNRPKKSILVATQVIEQSLDLDFDLMVSDVAPIDLVIQRAGRLHRHPRPGRRIATPSLWLLKPDLFGAVPEFGHSEYVYERYVLLRSFLKLRDLQANAIRLPDDIDALVEAVYCEEDSLSNLDATWGESLRESRQEIETRRREDAQKAFGRPGMNDGVVIEQPAFESLGPSQFFDRCQRCLDEENPIKHKFLRAATRLTKPTVQLVLWSESDGPCDPEIEIPPSFDEAKRILGRSVSVQHQGVVRYCQNQPEPKGWRKSGLLHFHRVVTLDEAGVCELDRDSYRYDAEFGLENLHTLTA